MQRKLCDGLLKLFFDSRVVHIRGDNLVTRQPPFVVLVIEPFNDFFDDRLDTWPINRECWSVTEIYSTFAADGRPTHRLHEICYERWALAHARKDTLV